jgi:hypothetical protein
MRRILDSSLGLMRRLSYSLKSLGSKGFLRYPRHRKISMKTNNNF